MFNDITYRDFCSSTCLPQCDNVPYLTLGLNGEAGEVAEIVKKGLRSETPVNREELLEELGDVLYYLTRIADKFEFTLSDVSIANRRKLIARIKEGRLVS